LSIRKENRFSQAGERNSGKFNLYLGTER
jgi:hypothetical protein